MAQGMQLTTANTWASKCPRCFGPKSNKVKVNPLKPDIIIAMDGNFQQRQYAYASKDDPPKSKFPPIFIRPSDINPDAALFTATDELAHGIDVSN